MYVRQLWLLLAQLPRWGNCNPTMINYMSLNIAAWIYDNAQEAQNLKVRWTIINVVTSHNSLWANISNYWLLYRLKYIGERVSVCNAGHNWSRFLCELEGPAGLSTVKQRGMFTSERFIGEIDVWCYVTANVTVSKFSYSFSFCNNWNIDGFG